VKEALSGVKVQKTAANISKQKTIPNVLPTRGVTKTVKQKGSVVYGGGEERARAFNDLIK
jgi:hypothetical protein